MRKRLTKSDYARARNTAKEEGKLTVGSLINRLRISSVDAKKIYKKLIIQHYIDQQGKEHTQPPELHLTV